MRREKRHERVCAARDGLNAYSHKTFSHRRRRQSRDDGGRPALIGKLTDGVALRIFGSNVCAGSNQQPYDLRVCVCRGYLPQLLSLMLQPLRSGEILQPFGSVSAMKSP